MDLLAPWDMLMRGGLTHCTACGRAVGARTWVNTWIIGALAVAIAICDRCATTTDWRAQLRSLMLERYKEGRFDAENADERE